MVSCSSRTSDLNVFSVSLSCWLVLFGVTIWMANRVRNNLAVREAVPPRTLSLGPVLLQYLRLTSAGTAFDVLIGALSVLSTVLFIYDTYHEDVGIVFQLEITVANFFMMNWLMYFCAVPSKLDYIVSIDTFIDFSTCIPVLVGMCYSSQATLETGVLRSARIWRLPRMLRVFRLIRPISTIAKGGFANPIKAHIFKAICWFTIFLVIVSGIVQINAAFDYENDDPWQSSLNKLQLHDALYFTIVTISTVGYGDISPPTAQARLLLSCLLLGFMIMVPLRITEFSELFKLYTRTSSQAVKTKLSTRTVVIFCEGTAHASVASMVHEIYHQDRGISSLNVQHVVVMITCEPDDLEWQNLNMKYQNVTIMKGNALLRRDLERAGAAQAVGFFILANPFTDDVAREESTVLRRALAVRNFVEYQRNTSVAIYVQVISEAVWERLVQLGFDGSCITCFETLRRCLLLSTCVCPGISSIIQNSLTSSSASEIFPSLHTLRPPIPEWCLEYARSLTYEVYKLPIGHIFPGCPVKDLIRWLYLEHGVTMMCVALDDEKAEADGQTGGGFNRGEKEGTDASPAGSHGMRGQQLQRTSSGSARGWSSLTSGAMWKRVSRARQDQLEGIELEVKTPPGRRKTGRFLQMSPSTSRDGSGGTGGRAKRIRREVLVEDAGDTDTRGQAGGAFLSMANRNDGGRVRQNQHALILASSARVCVTICREGSAALNAWIDARAGAEAEGGPSAYRHHEFCQQHAMPSFREVGIGAEVQVMANGHIVIVCEALTGVNFVVRVLRNSEHANRPVVVLCSFHPQNEAADAVALDDLLATLESIGFRDCFVIRGLTPEHLTAAKMHLAHTVILLSGQGRSFDAQSGLSFAQARDDNIMSICVEVLRYIDTNRTRLIVELNENDGVYQFETMKAYNMPTGIPAATPVGSLAPTSEEDLAEEDEEPAPMLALMPPSSSTRSDHALSMAPDGATRARALSNDASARSSSRNLKLGTPMVVERESLDRRSSGGEPSATSSRKSIYFDARMVRADAGGRRGSMNRQNPLKNGLSDLYVGKVEDSGGDNGQLSSMNAVPPLEDHRLLSSYVSGDAVLSTFSESFLASLYFTPELSGLLTTVFGAIDQDLHKPGSHVIAVVTVGHLLDYVITNVRTTRPTFGMLFDELLDKDIVTFGIYRKCPEAAAKMGKLQYYSTVTPPPDTRLARLDALYIMYTSNGEVFRVETEPPPDVPELNFANCQLRRRATELQLAADQQAAERRNGKKRGGGSWASTSPTPSDLAGGSESSSSSPRVRSCPAPWRGSVEIPRHRGSGLLGQMSQQPPGTKPFVRFGSVFEEPHRDEECKESVFEQENPALVAARGGGGGGGAGDSEI